MTGPRLHTLRFLQDSSCIPGGATWMEYATQAPGRVLVLDYKEFIVDSAGTLEQLLAPSGMPKPREVWQTVLSAAWKSRGEYRLNKGISSRGRKRFTPEQLARLERQLDFYPDLARLKNRLIPPSAS